MLQKVLLPYLFKKKEDDNEKNILINVKKDISDLVRNHKYEDNNLKLYN